MHIIKLDCEIIQEKYFNECENVASQWEVRWWRARHRFKEKKHKDKSCKQISRLLLLVGCRKTIKQILYHKRHVINLLWNRCNPWTQWERWPILGSSWACLDRSCIPHHQSTLLSFRQPNNAVDYWWRRPLWLNYSKYDTYWRNRLKKLMWIDGWRRGIVWTWITYG